MNKPTKSLLPFLFLLVCAACDTTEDAYTVGNRPKDEDVLNVGEPQLNFKPEGGTMELSITSIARWEVTFSKNEYNQFSVDQTSGKGNGMIRVTCKPYTYRSEDSHQGELRITPVNFEQREKTVSLVQNPSTFKIESPPSSDPVGEDGSSVKPLEMIAYSSLDWKLEATKGNMDWLLITPGSSGEGNQDNTPIYFTFQWKPNYEREDREIHLQFKPQSSLEGVTAPDAFILRQNAGTLPQNLRCSATLKDYVNAELSLSYSSRSAVKDCGLNVYKVVGENKEQITTLRPEGGEYSMTGNYNNMSWSELPEDCVIRIEPFVENMVGLYVGNQNGEYCEFRTDTKPQNRNFKGVSILNTAENPVSATVDYKSATVSFCVISDVEPLGSDRLESVTVTVNEITKSGTPESVEPGKWRYTIAFEGLEPNHKYDYVIMVKGKDLPSAQGRVDSNSDTFSGDFKTKGQTPADNDNNRPVVGE